MEIFRKIKREDWNRAVNTKTPLDLSSAPCYTGTLWMADKIEQPDDSECILVLEASDPRLGIEWKKPGNSRLDHPYITKPVKPEYVQKVLDTYPFNRVNILMNSSLINEPRAFKAVKPFLHAKDQVCVLALSFFDDTKTEKDWNIQFKKGQGIWYCANTDVFKPFGIGESQIHWINFFTQSPEQMKEILVKCNVLMIPGGAPDLLMKRIKQLKLKPLLKHWQGTIIGYSAGAMAQLEDYHITPDEDYSDFSWNRGMGWLSGLDVEVHFKNTSHQRKYARKAFEDKLLPIYAIYEQGGLAFVNNELVSSFGKVDVFEKEEDF